MFLVSCYCTVSSFSRAADVSLKNLPLFMWLHPSEYEPGKLNLSDSLFPLSSVIGLFLLLTPYLFTCLHKFFQSPPPSPHTHTTFSISVCSTLISLWSLFLFSASDAWQFIYTFFARQYFAAENFFLALTFRQCNTWPVLQKAWRRGGRKWRVTS